MATLRAAPTRHRHTEQFSGILTDPILTQPTPRGREGWEKPKHKLARKQQAIATTLCEELQASNCVYKSRGAPARGIGPPLLQLGKQLTSIALRLTLPKLHLATSSTDPKCIFNDFPILKFTQVIIYLQMRSFQIGKFMHFYDIGLLPRVFKEFNVFNGKSSSFLYYWKF